MKKVTTALFVVALLLIIYGFICRPAKIYFFWDSGLIGGMLLVIALIVFLFGLKAKYKAESRSATWIKWAIGLWSFVLVGVAGMLGYLSSLDASKAAKEALRADVALHNHIGEIKAFGLLTSGEIDTEGDDEAEAGTAEFSFTVKGEKKIVDATVKMSKKANEPWKMVSIDY